MKSINKNHKQIVARYVLLIGTIISLFFVPWQLLWAQISPLPDSVQEQVDDAIKLGFDGIIAYVDQGGKEAGFYAAGWDNREEKIPADPHALFKIASIAKLYDAVAVSKLVHGGQLSLDKTLEDYFPELVGRIENAENITLRMMVQHRSGIPNFTDTTGYWENSPSSDKETLELVLDLPANFEPNQDYGYSNTNFLLLSMLMDNILGYGHFEFIREEILIPHGLIHTYESLSEVDIEDVMSGYYAGIEEDIKTADYGSMIASAKDVGKFLRALNDGSLFEEGEEEIYSSLYEYEHAGLIPGYQSIARYHEEIDTVVVQFVNTTNFEGNTWSLSEIVYDRIIKILQK